MALTEAQKLSIKEMLGLSATDTVLDTRFDDLTATEETRAGNLVTSWDSIRDQSTKLNVKGYSRDDELTKATLRRNMALLMGVNVTHSVTRLS